MTEFPIVVFHNPACGTSRNTVAMIRAAGYEPEFVEYLKTGWTVDQLRHLLDAMGARPRDILRDKGTPAAELGLLNEGVSDEEILEAMVAHPILEPADRRQPPGNQALPAVGGRLRAAGPQARELHEGGRRGRAAVAAPPLLCAQPLLAMDDPEKLYDRAAELVRKASGASSRDERMRLLREAKAIGLRAAQLAQSRVLN